MYSGILYLTKDEVETQRFCIMILIENFSQRKNLPVIFTVILLLAFDEPSEMDYTKNLVHDLAHFSLTTQCF
jgi:hypothetical protein